MPRHPLPAAFAAAGLLLTGCGGDEADTSAAASTAASSRPSSSSSSSTAMTTSASPTTTASSLGQVDTYACQTFVAEAGDAYSWINTLERELSAGAEDVGWLEAYQIGGAASLYADQVESGALRNALKMIVTEGGILQRSMDGEIPTESPYRLRMALENAADFCEAGGFVVSWHI